MDQFNEREKKKYTKEKRSLSFYDLFFKSWI
jgi:hypothetical protein